MASQRREAAETALRDRIASGELKPGDRIGERLATIASDYGVGKTTMYSILTDLAGEGIIRSEHGVAYFVAGNGAAILAEQRDSGLAATVSKMQEDIAVLKADVAELKTARGDGRAARKREPRNEQSG